MKTPSFFYGVMVLIFLYSLIKYGGRSFHFFIILLFFDGMFAYAGTTIWNIYKIFLPVLGIYCFLKSDSLSGITNNDRPVIIAFFIFSASFILSSFLSGDYFNLTFSQYAKYFSFFVTFFILRKISNNYYKLKRINQLIFFLLIVQIGMTIVKFYIWGIKESVVGTISYTGGGVATVLPILGFIFIWLNKRGNLEKKDWVVIALLMFIGFVSMKRAIWFIMPVVIFLFYTYVIQKRISKKLLYAIPVIPIIFYLGVRYNTTLNPDNSLGGTFDLNYAFNYAKDYSFGTDKDKFGTGRGGATLLLFNKFISLKYTVNDIFGNGLNQIYSAELETYNDPGFGINHRGSATGVYQTYISAGFIGIIATIAFVLILLFQIKDKRFRNGLLIIFLWEYFFYSGLILRTQALSFLMVYFIIYVNIQYDWAKYSALPKLNSTIPTKQ